MRITLLLISFLLFGVHAHSNTVNSAGNWSNSSIWNGNDIADNVTESTVFNNNIGTVTFATTDYTVGTVNMGNGNTLTVSSGRVINIGDASNPDDLNVGNSATINVPGSLTIWGDLNINNVTTLNITGTLVIKGNVNLGNGGALTISGVVTVEGDFNAGTGTNLDVDGSLDITGNIDTGNGSTVTGTGSVSSGSCSGEADVCNDSQLPIVLSDFTASVIDKTVEIKWNTVTEINNDYFTVERSRDGIEFNSIFDVEGAGNSVIANSYTITDHNPIIGVSYYRLRQTDYDGKSETFKPVKVNNVHTFIKVYPNPIQSGHKLILELPFEEVFTGLRLIDSTGRVLPVNSKSLSTGIISISLPETSGIYFLKIQGNDFEFSKKLIVQPR